MADLEGEVQKGLTRLIKGQAVEITPYGRRVFALWAVKTAMMFQMTTQRRLIPSEHFVELFEHQRAPRQCYVWFARYQDNTHSLGRFVFQPIGIGSSSSSSSSVPDDGRTGRPDGYGVTLTIGHLILQVFGYVSDTRLVVTRGAQGLEELARRRRNPMLVGRWFGPEVVQLWPIQGSRRSREANVSTPDFGFVDRELFDLEAFFRPLIAPADARAPKP